MTETATAKTIKYGGSTIGVSAGNAIAYFGLEYARVKHGIVFEDPVVAMAMAGALVSVAVLEARVFFRAVVSGLKYVFDRMFPAKG